MPNLHRVFILFWEVQIQMMTLPSRNIMRIRNDYKLGVWYDSCPFLFPYGLKEKQRLCQFITNQHTYKQRNSLLKNTKEETKRLWFFKKPLHISD